MSSEELADLLKTLGLQKVVPRNKRVYACCPSHPERRPSWGISIEFPHFHGCYACNYKGTLRTLLADANWNKERIDNLLGYTDKGSLSQGLQFQRKEYAAKRFDQQHVWPFPTATKPVTDYLRSRGFPPELAVRYRLRHDVANNRLVFPWYSEDSIVGATGRAMDDNPAKIIAYGNFMKGHHFYIPDGVIDPDKPLYLVEGELDALALAHLNYNVAAVGQGKFTRHHLRILENVPVKFLVLCFDNDDHGIDLRKEVYVACSASISNIHDTTLAPRKDPADFFQHRHYGGLKSRLELTRSVALSGLAF